MKLFYMSLIAGWAMIGCGGMSPLFAQPGSGSPRPSPIIRALDTNQNGVLSADEINSAANALASLDANGDGVLGMDEIMPANRPGGPGGPGRGPNFPGSGGRGGPGAQAGGANGGGPGARQRGMNSGAGKPSMIDRLFQFDANADGLLSRDELLAAEHQLHSRTGGAAGGSPQMDRPRGPGGHRGGEVEKVSPRQRDGNHGGRGRGK